MKIIDYFRDERQTHWLGQIAQCEWRAAHYLAQLLAERRFHQTLGRGTLYLLTDGDLLVSFLTLTERDCIDDAALTPWIGFVYTAPEYRGRRCAGKLIDHAMRTVGDNGVEQAYLCTDHEGLYEKYGFSYIENRVSIYGEDSRVMVRRVERLNAEPSVNQVRFATPEDLPQWMALVRRVAWNFPGLETENDVAAHEATVAKFIGKSNAICAVEDGHITGVLLFSRRLNQLCCMAVAPEARRKGMARKMFDLMLTIADPARDLSVTTFRMGDPLGTAARAFYMAQGFQPETLIMENGHPCQRFVRRAVQE